MRRESKGNQNRYGEEVVSRTKTRAISSAMNDGLPLSVSHLSGKAGDFGVMLALMRLCATLDVSCPLATHAGRNIRRVKT